MRVLITRPEEDAARTAALLKARGHEAIIAPLLLALTLGSASGRLDPQAPARQQVYLGALRDRANNLDPYGDVSQLATNPVWRLKAR